MVYLDLSLKPQKRLMVVLFVIGLILKGSTWLLIFWNEKVDFEDSYSLPQLGIEAY